MTVPAAPLEPSESGVRSAATQAGGPLATAVVVLVAVVLVAVKVDELEPPPTVSVCVTVTVWSRWLVAELFEESPQALISTVAASAIMKWESRLGIVL